MSITDALTRERDTLVSSAVRHLNALVRKHGRHNIDDYHAASNVHQFNFVVAGRQESVGHPGQPGGRAAVRLLTTNGDGVTVFTVPPDGKGSVNVESSELALNDLIALVRAVEVAGGSQQWEWGLETLTGDAADVGAAIASSLADRLDDHEQTVTGPDGKPHVLVIRVQVVPA